MPEPPKLNLSRTPDSRPFLVDMERFFEFSFWMAEELLDLIAEYRPAHCSLNDVCLKNDIRLQRSDRFGLHVD